MFTIEVYPVVVITDRVGLDSIGRESFATSMGTPIYTIAAFGNGAVVNPYICPVRGIDPSPRVTVIV